MKAFRIFCIALFGIAVCSCTPNAPSFNLSDLQGLWQNDKYDTWHVRFTTEPSDEAGYYWGCEWGDFGDDVTEEDLVYHGNGWFKYSFKSAELIEIHRMDEGWADIPKVYIVTGLNDTDLDYYEKDHSSIKFHFTKVVETK